jgi:hypothetical protein
MHTGHIQHLSLVILVTKHFRTKQKKPLERHY